MIAGLASGVVTATIGCSDHGAVADAASESEPQGGAAGTSGSAGGAGVQPGGSAGEGGTSGGAGGSGGAAGGAGGQPTTGPNPVSLCPVPPMDQLYGGALPTNPYAAAPAAPDCIAHAHDVIIVLGCPSNEDGSPSACQTARADIAVQLMSRGYGSQFITSGGAVHNAHVEADSLEALLIERGVAKASVHTEPQAEHTDENLYFSGLIMKSKGWTNALVVSDDAGHLVMTAVCDSNCCVEAGRFTVFEFPVGNTTQKAAHYVLYPYASTVSTAECDVIRSPLKFMCTNLGGRRACANNFQL